MKLLSLKQIEDGMKAMGLTIEETKNAKYDKNKNLLEITVYSRYDLLNSRIGIYYDAQGRCFQRKNSKRVALMDIKI